MLTSTFTLIKFGAMMAKRAVLIQYQTFLMLHIIIKSISWCWDWKHFWCYKISLKSYRDVEERWRGEVTSTFTLNKFGTIMAKRSANPMVNISDVTQYHQTYITVLKNVGGERLLALSPSTHFFFTMMRMRAVLIQWLMLYNIIRLISRCWRTLEGRSY